MFLLSYIKNYIGMGLPDLTEVRAERDVLQARMSEQALRISSLSARLQQHRNDADALSHEATSRLAVQLHDATAEVQRLKEELEARDKHLARLKQNLDERDKLNEQHHTLYGNSCNPKDKVIILERELSAAQSRVAQLESLASTLENDKEQLQALLRDQQRNLAERDEQLQELMALKLDDDQKEEKSEVLEGKVSARTLSDIVSISEFDEQDLQMRRAELKAQNISLSEMPYSENRVHNRTLPPDLQKQNMSSLNLDNVDHFDLPSYTPRADSLPAHLTSTQIKNQHNQYKRNVNETTMFGTIEKIVDSVKQASAQKIADNCSMYPNRDVSESKNITCEPKKINFSIEPSHDNKTSNDDIFTSLQELGITLDVTQDNFPDLLTLLKLEIKKSKSELENCKSELKNAEEQLCEFPALKEEVEELKKLLENTMATMENDKKFYENQLQNFSSNKQLLEQRLTELTQEVNDKTKDLHLLKEDILRRENMILELAKEKRNLTTKMTELEIKIDELQSRNKTLDKLESENHEMKMKIAELKKLEQLVSEKNQQIDSLNQHLDRLDDLQRFVDEKTEEYDQLKESYDEKSNELFKLQNTMGHLTKEVTTLSEENNRLNQNNQELKQQLTKIEKEQENASLKLQNSESELERVNSLNNEMTLKIEELKMMTEKLKDKETEIEILHEDINAFHEEIASLKEQLKMVSRSPSPRNKNGDEKRPMDRQANNDKKQLVKIRKQISLLQHELDFNKKELNDKAFELAKAKLDVSELKNNLSQANKQAGDKDALNSELRENAEVLQTQIRELVEEKIRLKDQLDIVVARMREESNVSELKAKLREKGERCQELECELQDLRELVDRYEEGMNMEVRGSGGPSRSPTAELERALRDQLQYSHTLDNHMMEQILSASSDEREDIPRLALNTSKSSSSIHSTSSERVSRLRADCEKLQLQLSNLEARLKDKDALIVELNRVRDKLVQECHTEKLRYEAERDNCGRLQLLLHAHKDTANSLQSQDSNMIQILKKRLESAMQSELELQQREQQLKSRLAQVEQNVAGSPGHTQLQLENMESLRGEISLLKSKLEVEHARYSDLQASLEHARLLARRELDERNEQVTQLRTQLAELKRLKHETSVELVRAKELSNTQADTISHLQNKLATHTKHRPIDDALTEIETHKTELAREISTLKQCIMQTTSPELPTLRRENQQLRSRVEQMQAELSALTTVDTQNAIRYLHGRVLRLESCRKALVWQKRYLQRVVDGYLQLERTLRIQTRHVELRGKKRFKCAALVVIASLRCVFLVRRRLHVRTLATACLLPHTSSPYTGTSPPCRDRPAGTLYTPTPLHPGLHPSTPTGRLPDSLARRLLKTDIKLNLPTSPVAGEYSRGSPYGGNTARDEPFILSSPRGEVAAAYLNKLEVVSRCLNQALDDRQVP